MTKHTLFAALLVSVFVLFPPLCSAQKALVKAGEAGFKALDITLEKQIAGGVEAALTKATLSQPALAVRPNAVTVQNDAWKRIENSAALWRQAQKDITHAQQSIAASAAELKAAGFEMKKDGMLHATTTESLELLRQHEMVLETARAFTVSDLAPFRPKLEHPNTRAALPPALVRDTGTRYLGYKYVGLRIGAEQDINSIIKEFKALNVTERIEEAAEETDNPPVIDGSIWLKRMEGLAFQLEIPDELAHYFNDFSSEALGVPYQIIGLVDVGYYSGYNPELMARECADDTISRIIMQLDVDGALRWCDVRVLPDGKFLVTPYAL